MSTDLVPGKYQLTESENFDKFMGALGVGYLVREGFKNSSSIR